MCADQRGDGVVEIRDAVGCLNHGFDTAYRGFAHQVRSDGIEYRAWRQSSARIVEMQHVGCTRCIRTN
jgi:hypothetical protein